MNRPSNSHLVRFILWFEKNHPGQPYDLKMDPIEGFSIITHGGHQVLFTDFYAYEALGTLSKLIGGKHDENIDPAPDPS